jgi:pimeloyl-ACP methyl ester carboxylesterase/quercetin dioxygenase-like cupin family protein
MQFVENPTDGVRIAVDITGAGRPLVIVHGSLSSSADWARVAAELGGAFTIYRMDRRGHGQSDDGADYAFDREVEDVAAVMHLAGKDAVLFGHSFGGALALEYATTTPPAALVVYEPGVRLHDLIGGDGIAPVEAALRAGNPDLALELGMLNFNGDSPDAVAAARASAGWAPLVSAVGTWPREIRGLDQMDISDEHLGTISSPTIALRGTSSPEWLKLTTARVADILPTGRLLDLPGQGHVAMATAPRLLADIIIRALSTHETPSDSPSMSTRILQADTSWNGTEYTQYPAGVPQLTVVRYSIPPHSSLPWHEHSAPNTAFIISGAITLTTVEGTTQTFTAGDAFAESVGNEHRGYTTAEGAEIVCTYAGAAGVPLSTPTGRLLT